MLNDLFSVTVHLRPAPVVARVPTWLRTLRPGIERSLRREVAVAGYLHSRGAPVVPPSAELPPGPHRHNGFLVTYATYVRPDPERAVTAEHCVSMVGELHDALRHYPGDVEPLGRAVVPLDDWLPHLDGWAAGLPGIDTVAIRRRAEALRPLLAPSPDDQVLHGDAHLGNLIPTADGALWIDFEDVCRGPARWDLVSAGATDGAGDLSDLGELRSLQVLMCLLGLRDVFGDREGWDAAIGELAGSLDAVAPGGVVGSQKETRSERQ